MVNIMKKYMEYISFILIIMMSIYGIFLLFHSHTTDFDFLVRATSLTGNRKKTILSAGFRYSDTGLLKKNKKNNTYQNILLGPKRMEYRTDDKEILSTIISQMKNRVVFDTQESYTFIGIDEERVFEAGMTNHKFPLGETPVKVLYDPETVEEEGLIILIRVGK